MLDLSDKDTKKKSTRINKHEYNSCHKDIYHGNKNRMCNFQNHGKKNEKKQKGSSLNYKIKKQK